MSNVDNMEKEKSTTEYGEKTIDRGFIKDENKKDPAFDIVENFDTFKSKNPSFSEINKALLDINELRGKIDPARLSLAEVKLHILAASAGIDKIIEEKEPLDVYREFDTDNREDVKERLSVLNGFLKKFEKSPDPRKIPFLESCVKNVYRIPGMIDSVQSLDENKLKEYTRQAVAGVYTTYNRNLEIFSDDVNTLENNKEKFNDAIGKMTGLFEMNLLYDLSGRVPKENMKKTLQERGVLKEEEKFPTLEYFIRNNFFEIEDLKITPEVITSFYPEKNIEKDSLSAETDEDRSKLNKIESENKKSLIDNDYFKKVFEHYKKINPSIPDNSVEDRKFVALAIKKIIDLGVTMEYFNSVFKDRFGQ